jgi:hypothetical protein
MHNARLIFTIRDCISPLDPMPPAKPIHAIEYLDKPEAQSVPPVCVVFGGEPFLKRKVIGRIRRAVLGKG